MGGKWTNRKQRPNSGRVKKLYLTKKYSLIKIAKICGVSPTLIGSILTAARVKIRSSREQQALNLAPNYKLRNRDIEKQYRAGATVREIGEALGLSHARVAQILNDQEIPMRARGVRPS